MPRPSISAARRLTGGLLVSEVNGPAVDAINSFERPDLVGVQERRR